MTRTKSLLSLSLLASLSALGCESATANHDAATAADAPSTDIQSADVSAQDVTAPTDTPAADRPDAPPPSDVLDAGAPTDTASPRDVVDAPAPSDVVDASAPTDGGPLCTLTRALVTTTDFVAGGYAMGPFGTPALMAAGAMAPDQDHVPVQSGCVVFNLLRAQDSVAVLNNASLPSVARRIPLLRGVADAGPFPYQVNPYDALTLSPTKAYVVQYALSHIAVLNPAIDGASALTGRIDLAPLRHPMDLDATGAPEATRIVQVGGRALVTLQNLSSFAPIANGTLAVIDTATDALVDLDAMAAGTQGVTLSARNPVGLSVTPSGRRVVVSSVGVQAFTAPQVLDGAVEAIDAMSLQPSGMRITEATFGGDLSDHVMLDDDRGWVVVTRLPSDAGPGDARVMEFNLATGAVGRTIYTAGSIATLARDPSGSVWVLDRTPGSHGVRVFNPDGSPRGAALNTALPPFGIAFVP